MTYGKLEWFGGNKDALRMLDIFVELTHIWDDLVDKDKEVTEDQVNNAFLACLVYLPMNRFYQQIYPHIVPMLIVVASAYQTANKFERDKDPHGIEIAHSLRYSLGNVIAYAIYICVGPEKAREFLPEMWKTVFHERFDDYRKEHLDV